MNRPIVGWLDIQIDNTKYCKIFKQINMCINDWNREITPEEFFACKNFFNYSCYEICLVGYLKVLYARLGQVRLYQILGSPAGLGHSAGVRKKEKKQPLLFQFNSKLRRGRVDVFCSMGTFRCLRPYHVESTSSRPITQTVHFQVEHQLFLLENKYYSRLHIHISD